ncbi:MAG: Fic family protein [Parachlamydiaceae bacterium]|nr:Fic family protein [Parachlamydiaceae bacterium]
MGIFLDIVSSDSIIITPEMLNLISEIDEFKGAWQQLGRLTPDRLSALKRVATIESIGSSTRIEGAKLSDNQIENLLLNAADKSFQTRDEQEVAGYAFVCEQIFNHYHDITLTENTIKQLHTSLLQYTDKDERHRGEYKKNPIRIEAFDSIGKSVGIIFETTSPLETPFKMQSLIIWMNDAFAKKIFHPLIIIGIFIVLFLAIHPFQDGNGRLSRLLTTLLMLKCGYFYAPYSSLESIIEANKEGYYLALQRTQKSWQNNNPDWNPWLLFFFNCLQRQKKHLEIKLEKERMLFNVLPPLSSQILELLKAHGRLGISEIAVLTNANRNTLKKTLVVLVKENYIIRKGVGKASWYSSNL